VSASSRLALYAAAVVTPLTRNVNEPYHAKVRKLAADIDALFALCPGLRRY
jgi:hypothetical protein